MRNQRGIGMGWKNRITRVISLIVLVVNLQLVSGASLMIVSGQFLDPPYTTSVAITSDIELGEASVSGSGSLNNPYKIRVNLIEDNQGLVVVSNTRAHFVISDSIIWSHRVSEFSIHFENVSHGQIEHTTLRSDFASADIGIWIENCTDIRIVNVSIDGYDDGVLLESSKECQILNCSIFENDFGIHLDEANSSLVYWNTIVHNDIGVRTWGTNNRIYSNKLGWNSENGRDLGVLNYWDDGISMGNSWSDYDGEGIYNLTGRLAGLDQYPTILSDGDYSGPVITHEPPYSGPTNTLFAFSFEKVTITANVTDPSGVDSVLLWFSMNGTLDHREMTRDSASSNNHSYSIVFHGPFTDFMMSYFIWANDSIGYSEFGPGGGFSVHARINWFFVVVIVGPSIAIIIIAVVILTRRCR
ncbi:MAG: NosD domain-containing protein [Candidatus Thorarchaeota archaeon]